jgi:hypothetical protein
MEVISSYETSVDFQRATRSYITEGRTLQYNICICFCGLFNHNLWKSRLCGMIEERWIGCNGGTITTFSWRDWRKPWRTWASIASVPAYIWAEHFSNTYLKHQRYTHMLRNIFVAKKMPSLTVNRRLFHYSRVFSTCVKKRTIHKRRIFIIQKILSHNSVG